MPTIIASQGGVYTTPFLTKNILCVLAIHLHDNDILGL